ncbi:MAG: hemerythrin domain-containing protein [Dehalococcoidia bacterium]|nr:hemerythrin domain-containing protein [Dehalococcoidia bacterium]
MRTGVRSPLGDFRSDPGHAEVTATFGNLETDVEPLAGLMREHIEVHGLVTAAREAVDLAIERPGQAELALAAMENLRDLVAYLEVDLVIHIAKEEDVLFPALRGFAAEVDKVVAEMVEQHDEVRLRKAIIERALAHVDGTHDEVQVEAAGISAALARAGHAPSVEALIELLDGVKRLDWILQGHFGDEEDDLFPPALELLTPEVFAELARQAKALEE